MKGSLDSIRTTIHKNRDIASMVQFIIYPVHIQPKDRDDFLNKIVITLVRRLWRNKEYRERMLNNPNSGVNALLDYIDLPRRYVFGDDDSGYFYIPVVDTSGEIKMKLIDNPDFKPVGTIGMNSVNRIYLPHVKFLKF